MPSNYLWISHSALRAFERCPQSYYYQYQYRNPDTGNRIQIVNPYFSLGLSVHETIEDLSPLSIEERLNLSLQDQFEKNWKKYSGKKGGFISSKQEEKFKKRGERMIERVLESGFLEKPSIEIDETVPSIDLIPEENIKLVGSMDWIQVLPEDGLHIIDFKTGKSKEGKKSLQLPIYNILANSKLDGKIEKISYWYLESDDELTSRKLDSIDNSLEKIKKKALEIKDHVENNNYPCHYNGRCFACGDYKRIFAGQAEFLGTQNGKDLYFVYKEDDIAQKLIDEEAFTPREEKIFELRVVKGFDKSSISDQLNIGSEKLKKIVNSIKSKMVDELTQKELKILINKKMKNNGYK